MRWSASCWNSGPAGTHMAPTIHDGLAATADIVSRLDPEPTRPPVLSPPGPARTRSPGPDPARGWWPARAGHHPRRVPRGCARHPAAPVRRQSLPSAAWLTSLMYRAQSQFGPGSVWAAPAPRVAEMGAVLGDPVLSQIDAVSLADWT